MTNDDLRALAKAATSEDGYRIEYNDLTGDMYATERGSGSEYGATAVIAQHVIRQFGRLWAGATPEAILALLDEVDALRDVRDAAAEVIRFYGTDRTWSLIYRELLGSRIDDLEAALAPQLSASTLKHPIEHPFAKDWSDPAMDVYDAPKVSASTGEKE